MKIFSSRMSEGTWGLIERLGSAIAGKIQGTYTEPELLSVFPEEHRVRMSERFIPKDFLGQPFLKNGYRVDYEEGGRGYQVFLVQEDSREEAERVFDLYQDFLRIEQVKISLSMQGGFRRACVEGEKRKALFQYGRFFGGILNGRDVSEDGRIIELVVTRLKGFSRGRGQ